MCVLGTVFCVALCGAVCAIVSAMAAPARNGVRVWRGYNGAVLPGPFIDGTNLVVMEHAFPARRTWWQEQLYSLGKLVVLALSFVLDVGNMAYRVTAALTFGVANTTINFLSRCLTHLLACCLRRHTPAGLPYVLEFAARVRVCREVLLHTPVPRQVLSSKRVAADVPPSTRAMRGGGGHVLCSAGV